MLLSFLLLEFYAKSLKITVCHGRYNKVKIIDTNKNDRLFIYVSSSLSNSKTGNNNEILLSNPNKCELLDLNNKKNLLIKLKLPLLCICVWISGMNPFILQTHMQTN